MQDLDGRKPLHYAADFGHGTVVDYLIGKGAEINAKDKHDITPLLAAIFEGIRFEKTKKKSQR